MFSTSKSTHIDRDDFDADHYADSIRDTHRSRLTSDQLDIAKRQLRRKEKLLTRVHDLKMKEHMRIKNGFIRKIEQDQRISTLPVVQQTLNVQRHKHLDPSPSLNSHEQPTKQGQNSHRLEPRPKTIIRPESTRTQRLKANIEKFNHIETFL